MGSKSNCKGEHKPTFKYIGRDLSWYHLDGSWWYTFECHTCGNRQSIADWWFWGKEYE